MRGLIGPLLTTDPLPGCARWWSLGVDCEKSAPDTEEAPPRPRDVFSPGDDPGNLDPLPSQLATCHAAAYELLDRCIEAAERLAQGHVPPEELEAVRKRLRHGYLECRRTRVQPVMDALAVCAWIESLDAERVACLVNEEPARAHDIAQDIRDLARTLGAEGTLALLESRVDSSPPLDASIIGQPEWPSIAWELVACTASIRARWTDWAEHLGRAAGRIAREQRLAEEDALALATELTSLVDALPPGFQWSTAMEDALCAHAAGRIADFRSAMGDAPPTGALCARTVAWEFYGYAWAQPGAIPAVERQRVRAERDVICAELEQAFRDRCRDLSADQWAVVQPEMAQGLAAIRAILENPWNPWAVFAREPEVLRSAMRSILTSMKPDHGEPLSPAQDAERLQWLARHLWSSATAGPSSLGVRPATAHRSRLVPWRHVGTGVFGTPWVTPFKP